MLKLNINKSKPKGICPNSPHDWYSDVLVWVHITGDETKLISQGMIYRYGIFKVPWLLMIFQSSMTLPENFIFLGFPDPVGTLAFSLKHFKIFFYFSLLNWFDTFSMTNHLNLSDVLAQGWGHAIFFWRMFSNFLFGADIKYRPPGEFRGKKRFLKRLISFKKRFSNLRIKSLKYANRLKGTPCDQS